MNDWNTNWDPYEALKACEHNVGQCIVAINNGTEVMKDLAHKYNHQQEVIQQLMFQNNKLLQNSNSQRLQIQNLVAELEQLKQQM